MRFIGKSKIGRLSAKKKARFIRKFGYLHILLILSVR